jgi:hypothetical protein
MFFALLLLRLIRIPGEFCSRVKEIVSKMSLLRYALSTPYVGEAQTNFSVDSGSSAV